MAKEIALSISCNQCVRRGTADCADCLVTFVLDDTPDQLVLSTREAAVADLFTGEGLVPTLKFHRVTD